jgi:hypothetical protein
MQNKTINMSPSTALKISEEAQAAKLAVDTQVAQDRYEELMTSIQGAAGRGYFQTQIKSNEDNHAADGILFRRLTVEGYQVTQDRWNVTISWAPLDWWQKLKAYFGF